jgi:histidinol-phosphate aminotransferase
LIRLNLNENPYPPPREVIEEAKKGLSDVNRYCDLKCMEKLKELLEDYTGISRERIIISPGSDIILREVIHTFSTDRKVVMPYPSFFPALECAKRHSKKLVRFQLTPPGFNLSKEAFLREITTSSLIIIDNPNNPTGKEILDRNIVIETLRNKDSLLLVDEAYYEFSKKTFSNLINSFVNLAIARTLDKAFSLAGLRIGYLLAGDYFKEGLSDFITFLPRPTVYAAIAALKNREYMEENVEKIIQERERLTDALRELGFDIFPSSANFILVRSNISGLGEKLAEKGILIRDLSRDWIPGYYRITIGLPEENDLLLKCLKEIIADLHI